jgi:NAD(P)-dependent dehydrogenase (short-subunit alcohol dehydrogenase family)
MLSLQGQAAILTGGSTELARALAVGLVEAGLSVCLCGKNAQLVEETSAALTARGGRCLGLLSPLDTLEAAESVVNQTLAAFGRLDILVSVSPFFAGGQIHTLSLRAWDAVLNANLRETFLIARAVLPHLREQKRGQILAVGSDSGLGAYAQDGAYGVAMHGLNALIEQIRVENAELGLRAHILCPGLALSPLSRVDQEPVLSTTDVVDWALWLLTRPAHLRGSGPIQV